MSGNLKWPEDANKLYRMWGQRVVALARDMRMPPERAREEATRWLVLDHMYDPPAVGELLEALNEYYVKSKGAHTEPVEHDPTDILPQPVVRKGATPTRLNRSAISRRLARDIIAADPGVPFSYDLPNEKRCKQVQSAVSHVLYSNPELFAHLGPVQGNDRIWSTWTRENSDGSRRLYVKIEKMVD